MARMTNAATIATSKMLEGISEDCHTYQHWRALGRQVKRGEKALFMAPMWKPNVKRDERGEETRKGFFAKSSAFFAFSQTEEVR